MSRITELLDLIKEQQGLTSNYALAKLLQINEGRISEYYKGIGKPDDYAITRVALTLQMEPIHLLAEIRAEDEKNPTKRGFWINFLRHAAVVIVSVGALVLGSASTSEAVASTASFGRYDINGNYARLRSWLNRLSRLIASIFNTPVFGA